MTNLCPDIGYLSVNHFGEELCGDHVDVVSGNDGSKVIVLADGLGSGVKASILSTLTAKIISTMLAAGMGLEDCVSTIAATLPVDAQRGVAYSTFTILHLQSNQTAELIQFDNPLAVLIRNGKNVDYPRTELNLDGKKIYRSFIRLQEEDVFLLMSDGCPHAGIGIAYNFGWKREDIIDFMEPLTTVGYTAKTLAPLLVNECFQLYGGQPGDDATACVVRARRRTPMNLLFGPPANRDDANRMMSLFFSKEGKHIICGGTTASIAANYLGKPLVTTLDYVAKDVPPISKLESVDLVTEGIITVNKVLTYAKDYLRDNLSYEQWNFQNDGASQIARLLFEEATDINFYVGRAINPAHQDPRLPINFSIKMNLVKELSACLEQMGKRIKVSYF